MARSGPPDGGWGWVVVACSFMNHMLLEGYIRSFGLIYLQLLDRYEAGATATTWLHACFNALQQMGIGPFLGFLIERFTCRKLAIFGGVAFSAAYLMSAFAPSIYFLYFSYSIVGGLGSGLIYSPIVIIVNDYFVKKRGKAMGLAALGAAAGTFAMPPLILLLFHQFGYTGSFMVLAAIALNHCVFAAFYRPLDTKDNEVLDQIDVPQEAVSGSGKEIDGVEANLFAKPDKNSGREMQVVEPQSVFEINQQMSNRTNNVLVPSGADDQKCDREALSDDEKNNVDSNISLNNINGESRTSLKIMEDVITGTEANVSNLEETRGTQVESSSSLNVNCQHQSLQSDKTEMTSSLGVIPTMKKIYIDEARLSSSMGMIPAIKRIRGNQKQPSIAGESKHLMQGRNGSGPFHRDLYLLRMDPWASSNSYIACGSIPGSVHVLPHAKINGTTDPNQHSGMIDSCLSHTGTPTRPTQPSSQSDTSADQSPKLSLLGRLRLRSRLAVMRNASFLMYCFLLFTIPSANTATFVFLPGLAEERGVSDTRAAMLVSIIGAANAVGTITIGFIFDIPFISDHRRMFHSCLGLLLGISVFTMSQMTNFVGMAAIAGWYGFALAGVMGQRATALSQYVTTQQLPSAFGFMIVFQGLGNLAGLTLQGYLKDVSNTYAACFYYGGSLVSTSSLLLICDYMIRIILKHRSKTIK